MKTKKFGFYFLLFIILALAVKFYCLISVFLPSIATACVLAYLFNPIYRYFLKITKWKSISACIIIFIIFFMILIPSTLVIFGIQKEISLVFNEKTYALFMNALTSLQNILNDQFSIDISDHISNIQSQIIASIQSAVTVLAPKFLFSITGFALNAFITIFVMYYLLTDSEAVIATFKEYFPLSDVNCNKLFREVSLNVRSLVLGQLLIAVIQGVLGGIGFLIFGIPGALLWGFVTVIMSLIPLLGAMTVWLPAGLIELAQHHYFSGIGIMLWGGLFVGAIDNIVRPKLTGLLGNIHPVIVLLGVFIGIREWGFIGLVLGPLIITIILILIHMFREEYGEVENDPKPKEN